MTSSVTIPDSTRISQHRDCELDERFTHFGKLYRNYNPILWLEEIATLGRSPAENYPIICGSSAEIESLRRLFDHRNLHRIKLESRGQKFIFGPTPLENLQCPPGSFAKLCKGLGAFRDNADWNDLAMIVSRFDLFKRPFEGTKRSIWDSYRTEIEKRYGCGRSGSARVCEGRWSVAFAAFLSKFKPGRTEALDSLSQCYFLSMFILGGSVMALIRFAIEVSIQYIPQTWFGPSRFGTAGKTCGTRALFAGFTR